MAGAELDVDLRIDFIGEICMKVFPIDEDTWAKFSSLHENHRKFAEFLDSPDEPRQLILVYRDFQLEVYNSPLTLAIVHLSEPILYFLKKDAEPVSSRCVRDCLIFGTLYNDVLHQILSFLSQEVLVGIVRNDRLDPIWTTTVDEEIQKLVKEAATEAQRIRRRCKGETVLSVQEDIFQDNLSGPAQVAEAEALALMWEQLLQSMQLRWESDLHDEKYWKLRCEDLDRVYHQLTSEVSKKASKILEVSGSIHTGTMRRLIIATTAAMAEAKTVFKSIRTVTDSLKKITSQEESEDLLNNIDNLMEDFANSLARVQEECIPLKNGICAQKLLQYSTIAMLDKIASSFKCSVFEVEREEFERKIGKAKGLVEKFSNSCGSRSIILPPNGEKISESSQSEATTGEQRDPIVASDDRSRQVLHAIFDSFTWKIERTEDIVKRSLLLAQIQVSPERLTPKTLLLFGRLKAVALGYREIADNPGIPTADQFLISGKDPEDLDDLQNRIEELTKKLKMITEVSENTECISHILSELEGL